MLNKAIKEVMNQKGVNAKTLCVVMGQLESTFSRMFMKDDSDPKASSMALLARRLNIKVSDLYLEKERLEPELCRFFYSEYQKSIKSDNDGFEIHPSFVYIKNEWVEFTEKKSSLSSSNFKDVIYLGEAPRWHTKKEGNVHCPDLYKKLCDEKRIEELS
tara:strand:+ start:1231 stop:1707 length:477 start_codon:yes stop_codon:yes gene_type:complete